jgi:hypothetical protein
MVPPALSRHEAVVLLRAIEDGCDDALYLDLAARAREAAHAVSVFDMGEMQRLFRLATWSARMCRRGFTPSNVFYLIAWTLCGAMRRSPCRR